MELDELKKLQSSVEDAARSIEQTVTREVSDTEKQLQSLTDPTATGKQRFYRVRWW